MDVLSEFLTMPVLLFCLAIWLFVLFQRLVVELVAHRYWKNIKESKLWRDLFLPFGPIGTGMFLAIMLEKYPFPEMLASDWTGRAILGIGCGAFAGTVYQSSKAFVKNKFTTSSQ